MVAAVATYGKSCIYDERLFALSHFVQIVVKTVNAVEKFILVM